MTTNKYQTFFPRFFAAIIDGLIFLPLSLVLELLPVTTVSDYILAHVAEPVLYLVYVIIGHGKHGRTVGKKLMKIKVLDISESGVIGYKRAFFRESIWFFTSLLLMTYFFIRSGDQPYTPDADWSSYDNMMLFISVGWLLLELATMLSNPKRRAVHDFIAGSVVVRG